jgi:hypothetical protein
VFDFHVRYIHVKQLPKYIDLKIIFASLTNILKFIMRMPQLYVLEFLIIA